MSASLPTSVSVSALVQRARLSRESFDVVVIGGGINGCGIARDAAMRGLSVALLEQGDFGSGTSGRTSRLIHGGLRYLEHGHLGLVLEARRERSTLMRIAPHLVQPLRFTWPVYEGARVTRTKLGAGLALYDLLSLSRPGKWHQRLSAAEVLAREPALKQAALTGGGSYFDSSTDDARLTLANAMSAAYWNAAAVNYMSAEVVARDGETHRVSVTDALTREHFTMSARVVVRAVGPWSSPAPHSKGSHIAVQRDHVRNHGAIALLSPVDGRVMFILPAGSHTIIGTTETVTASPPGETRASESEIAYLLQSANSYLADARLRREDVVSAWAGLRPLAPGVEGDPSSTSREHSVTRDAAGVINITGGKLTTYRAVAEEAVDLLQVTLGMRKTRSRTAVEPLPGADRDAAIRDLIRQNPLLGNPLIPGSEVRGADLVYAVRHEMALTLGDLLVRRTRAAFTARDHALSLAAPAADVVAPLLGWSAEVRESRIAEYAREVSRMFTVDPA